jgi:hypothetical protein
VRSVARAVNEEGVPIEDQTDVTSYFVDEEKEQPISKDEITRLVTIYICGPPQSSQE